MSEIFHRNDAVLAEVDTRQRLITTLAVPWDQEAEVPWRGEIWNEVMRRGAFDGLEDHVGRVRVNREHQIGDTVGKLVFADPKAEDGLITRAKIAQTARGDDTLTLAEEDAISPSVGYRIKDPADLNLNRRTRMREVLRAFLHHLSLVESPAFTGAKILEVREAEIVDEEPPGFATTLNSAWSDPEYLRALDRLTKIPSGDR
jgi:HK97 family phage prohead protease